VCKYFSIKMYIKNTALLCSTTLISSPLNEAFEKFMQDVWSKPHQLDVRPGAINALAVHYWPLKHVGKLCLSSEVVWSYKVHHAPVFKQIVLQWIPSQYNPPSAHHNIINLLNQTFNSPTGNSWLWYNVPSIRFINDNTTVLLYISFLIFFKFNFYLLFPVAT